MIYHWEDKSDNVMWLVADNGKVTWQLMHARFDAWYVGNTLFTTKQAAINYAEVKLPLVYGGEVNSVENSRAEVIDYASNTE